ncbi:MAG: FAD-dependent oxidoreductase [Rhodocyclaceae bacterium]|nr:FAD-dependent oxidoreductase [Rhodocyclaceae bacterium]MBK9624033.1 FAD-dependent oxidoreductase [Rhodocyclaceae bacterium]
MANELTTGVLIVGSGMAGVTLARELRKLDANVDITLISADGGGFYSKPNISNALAAGKSADQLMMSQRDALAAQLKIQIHSNVQVKAISPQSATAVTSIGDFEYQHLVLALGARPIRLPIAGDGAADVLSINHLDHYAEFRRALGGKGDGKKRVAILGAGLIGCEFANDLRLGGFEVEVFDLAPQALGRLLPAQTAAFLQQRMENAGVKFHFNTSIAKLEKSAQHYRLTDSHGASHEADIVLSAIGLIPEIELAKASGLPVNRGILVDQHLQANGGKGHAPIYALGDCMEISGLNLPFILPIMAQARALAKTLSGTPTELHYAAMPVVVKTPACPTVVCPPPQGSKGVWQEEVSADGVRALFVDANNKPLGFALLGSATTERQALAAQMPAWL